MSKIIIKNTQNADSRTANEKLSKKSLRNDTETHKIQCRKLKGMIMYE